MDPGDAYDGYNFCFKCGHCWISQSGNRPKRCPRCHSSRWDVPQLKKRVCKFCGHEWEIKDIKEPCPECGRRQFEPVSDRMLHCNQCDYDWTRRGDKLPQRCPLCHSTRWNEPKANMYMCQRCNHVWTNKVSVPKRCPNCQSTKWNEPVRKAECQRCGHIWVLRGDGMPKNCPSCKSTKWNEAPKTYQCPKCGRVSIVDDDDKIPRCSFCDRKGERTFKCPICGNMWSGDVNTTKCPRCFNPIYVSPGSTTMTVWTDGRFRLEYVNEDNFGYMYLWDGFLPVSTMYMHDVCARFDNTVEKLIKTAYTHTMDDEWDSLAKEMLSKENSYTIYISYFQKRLSLSYSDAKILAIHFTGMGPEAIALKFAMDPKDVRKAFDRIMAAYSDCGIVVDDTIFTENPFSFYGDN